MVKITLKYENNLRINATHEPSQTHLITDAPIDNHGKGESFSPTDLVATGLGACMITLIGIMAERHQIDISGLHGQVEKIMSQDSPRRIQKLICKLDCPSKIAPEKTKMLERAALTCPVKQSLSPDIELDIQFNWN